MWGILAQKCCKVFIRTMLCICAVYPSVCPFLYHGIVSKRWSQMVQVIRQHCYFYCTIISIQCTDCITEDLLVEASRGFVSDSRASCCTSLRKKTWRAHKLLMNTNQNDSTSLCYLRHMNMASHNYRKTHFLAILTFLYQQNCRFIAHLFLLYCK